MDGKHFENGAFWKRWPHDNNLISLTRVWLFPHSKSTAVVIDNDILEDIQVIEPEIRSSDRELYNVSENLSIWVKTSDGVRVVVGVVSSTKSESEESERFHFFRFRFRLRRLSLWSLMIQWKLGCRSRKPANRKARSWTLSLVYSSASACDSDNAVFTWL